LTIFANTMADPISDTRFNHMLQNLKLKEIGKKLRDLSWRGKLDRRIVNNRVEWTFRISDGVPNVHETVKDILSAWTAFMDNSEGVWKYSLSVRVWLPFPDGVMLAVGTDNVGTSGLGVLANISRLVL